jgi:hypothetical protein
MRTRVTRRPPHPSGAGPPLPIQTHRCREPAEGKGTIVGYYDNDNDNEGVEIGSFVEPSKGFDDDDHDDHDHDHDRNPGFDPRAVLEIVKR